MTDQRYPKGLTALDASSYTGGEAGVFDEGGGLRVSMVGYVGDLRASDGRVDGWAIVTVEPGYWLATLPIHELRRLLDGAEDVDLMGIPYHWRVNWLVLELGPARVIGTADEWWRLCDLLTDTARSTADLYEVPRAQPWNGPATEVSITSIEVNGETIDVPYHVVPSPEVTALARAGGFAAREFVELFGAEWRVPGGLVSYDSSVLVYVLGHPWQLAAVVDEQGLSLAKPQLRWDSIVEQYLEVIDRVPIDGTMPSAELVEIAQRLMRSRRRSFSWCRYCARQIPPELRVDRNTCDSCGSIWYGYVH